MEKRSITKRLSRITEEERFLMHRHGRVYELWRVLKIAREFIRGFRAFHFLPPAVTVFGSARFKEGHPYYQLAQSIGGKLAREGFIVVTGGGPGLMEAANRGAKEAGGVSMGANIILPWEQRHNSYLDRFVNFYYFFARKVVLVKYSYAFVIMPGGFGTLDEMSEALTLIQTGKLYDFPVILVGKSYWQGLLAWIEGTLLVEKTISPEDLNLFTVTDDPDEVVRIIRRVTDQLRVSLQPSAGP